MIDRGEHLRGDAAFLDAARRSGLSRFAVFADAEALLESRLPIAAAGVPGTDLEELRVDLRESVFLGIEDGAAWFGVDIAAMPGPSRESLSRFGHFVALGSIQDPVDGETWSFLSQARSLRAWNARSRHCPACGAPSTMRKAGYERACTNRACSAVQFPRSDPAIIVRVTHGDRCLLARQPSFRPGLFSVLAGFVEPGESLEDAVSREVWEEVGLRLLAVSYVSSQPWPFPTSLMVGFHADAASDVLDVDGREIESAEWLTRDAVRRRTRDGSLILPSVKSISRRLIDDWLLESH